MKSDQDLYDVTARILLNMREILTEIRPDIVLVHGDTSTTLSVSLAAFYQKIPVGHVEAGLRTGNMYSPWPEEVNRKLTSAIASYHFCPTETSKNNLLTENISNEQIFVTGNTVIDALKLILKKINSNQDLKNRLIRSLEDNGIEGSKDKIVLITGHRRENFGQGFLNICNAIKTLAQRNPHVKFIYPAHLNPNVRNPVDKILSKVSNIVLIDPLRYEEFVYLMSKAYLILTDSGGIQEEAPSLGKPVLVMRDTTERPEAIDAGTVKLLGSNEGEIVSQVQRLLDSQEEYELMSKASNPYGEGFASRCIVEILGK